MKTAGKVVMWDIKESLDRGKVSVTVEQEDTRHSVLEFQLEINMLIRVITDAILVLVDRILVVVYLAIKHVTKVMIPSM